MIQFEHSILDFVAPQELITLQMLDSLVGINELSHSSLSDVLEILFRIVPRLGIPNFQQACRQGQTSVDDEVLSKLTPCHPLSPTTRLNYHRVPALPSAPLHPVIITNDRYVPILSWSESIGKGATKQIQTKQRRLLLFLPCLEMGIAFSKRAAVLNLAAELPTRMESERRTAYH